MSSDTEKEKLEADEKKKRRTRKDGEGRDFVCPCGKSYLSYPALYTHIKTKHGGRPPSGTPNGVRLQINDQLTQKKKNPLSAIYEELERYLEKISKEEDKEFFPDFSIEDKAYLKEIVNEYEQNKDSQQNDGEVICFTINQIFGRFLLEVNDHVSPQGLFYLQNLILNLKKGIAKIKNSTFCKENNGSQLPNFFNEVILKDYISSPEKKKDEKIIHHKVLTLKIMFFLATWLYQENYTNLTVKFNDAI